MKYKCSKCGASVVVTPDSKVIAICKCQAAIVADMRAVAVGRGGLVGKK
jgi:DNA-directed RNA polymerase subunit RPC12/RpoP